MTREIYLIRHGQTEYNKLGIVQGRGVDSCLDEMGRQQAQLFHQAYRNDKFDHIYVSALKRTFETIASFVEEGNQFSKHSELDEIDWGAHEGKPSSPELREQYQQIVKGWKEGKLDMSVGGGESPLEVQERLSRFLKTFESEGPAKSLISCHGRAMRIFLCTALGKDLREMDNFPHTNLSLYKLLENSGEYRLALANDVTHLKGLTSKSW